MPPVMEFVKLIFVLAGCAIVYWAVMQYVPDNDFKKVIRTIVFVVLGLYVLWFLYVLISSFVGNSAPTPFIRR